MRAVPVSKGTKRDYAGAAATGAVATRLPQMARYASGWAKDAHFSAGLKGASRGASLRAGLAGGLHGVTSGLLEKAGDKGSAVGAIGGLAFMAGHRRRAKLRAVPQAAVAKALMARSTDGKFASHSTGYKTVTVTHRRPTQGQTRSTTTTGNGCGQRIR